MKKLVTSAIFVMAMMISAMAFGQETNGSTPADPQVKVSITKNGCICPSTGEVLSSWNWKQMVAPYHYTVGKGSSFPYSSIPYTGTVKPTETFQGYVIDKVNLSIQPTNKPIGSNSTIVDYVYNMIITLNPKSCCPSGAMCDCFNNTTE